jgi:hypothetical protein
MTPLRADCAYLRTAEKADYEEQEKMLNPLIPHFPLIRNSAQGIHRALVPPPRFRSPAAAPPRCFLPETLLIMRAYEITREAQPLGGWCQKLLAALTQMPARIHGMDDGDRKDRAKYGKPSLHPVPLYLSG